MDQRMTKKDAYRRMKAYQAPYWAEFPQMQIILGAQGEIVDSISLRQSEMMLDAFILRMSERRCEEWERWLSLPPVGTLQDRRLAVLNFFNHINKLTKTSIQTLVAQLYKNARAIVTVSDYTLSVIVKPLPRNYMDDLDLKPLIDQLELRKPCHLGIDTKQYQNTWGEIASSFATWQELRDQMPTWKHVSKFIKE